MFNISSLNLSFWIFTVISLLGFEDWYFLNRNPNQSGGSSGSGGRGGGGSSGPGGPPRGPRFDTVLGESSNSQQAESNNPRQNTSHSGSNIPHPGHGFSEIDGRIIIDDPTNVKTRGYIDPDTGHDRDETNQPFAGNLANALQYYNSKYIGSSIPKHKLDQDTLKFLSEFFKSNFNHVSQYRNNITVRDKLKQLR